MLLPIDGRRIAYDITGPEAAPVVCMTHSLASDGGSWAEQLPPLLSAGFRVLRIDMRGHGGSDPVAGEYTMRVLADDVATVLDALNIGCCHYVGLSIGGMIGQAFAIAYGQRLLSALWCDTLPCSPRGAIETWRQRMSAVREANSLASIADATMQRWFTDGFKARREGRWKQIRDTIVGTTAAGYLGCSAAILNFDFISELPSLRVPLLVACGADDPGTPPSENRRIAELVPGGRYEEIGAARHFCNVERPDAFNAILREWLKSSR
jgi:3-oxoadipate enol-lactonase